MKARTAQGNLSPLSVRATPVVLPVDTLASPVVLPVVFSAPVLPVIVVVLVRGGGSQGGEIWKSSMIISSMSSIYSMGNEASSLPHGCVNMPSDESNDVLLLPDIQDAYAAT